MEKHLINKRTLFSLSGINIKILFALRYFPKFVKHVIEWRIKGGSINTYFPQLSDYSDTAGTARGHYFHQDLIVAQQIYSANPKVHIDVGSRIDGFVAHVASFRKIKIIDIRTLDSSQHPNIEFVQLDLMASTEIEPVDSVSCLHAIEHFGLGRYGDPIDVFGHIKGVQNISKLVKHNGTLYISFPVSSKSRVEFNAHRVFHPEQFLNDTKLMKYFEVKRFDLIDDNDQVHIDFDYKKINNLHYGCGIFTLRKLK